MEKNWDKEIKDTIESTGLYNETHTALDKLATHIGKLFAEIPDEAITKFWTERNIPKGAIKAMLEMKDKMLAKIENEDAS